MAKPSEWLAESMTDLRLARAIRDLRDHSFWPRLLFTCQQSAEKAIKAMLSAHKVRIPKSHVIQELSLLLLVHEPSLKSTLEPAYIMTDYAVALRYPDALRGELTEEDVNHGILLAEKISQAATNIVQSKNAG